MQKRMGGTHILTKAFICNVKQDYYLYIDECGDQNLSNFDSGFPVFSLCGILLSKEAKELLERQVCRLKEDFWGTINIIIHSRDIRKCQKGFEILFDLDVKKRFYERVNEILSQQDVYKIVCCTILKEPYIRAFGKYNDIYAQSLSFVLERAVFCLDEIGEDIALHTIVEMRGKKEDTNLRRSYQELIDKGTYWITPQRLNAYVCDFTLLSKRANVVGLQIADLIAYPITRHILNPEEMNLSYNVIKSNIYSDQDKMLGLKIIPGK